MTDWMWPTTAVLPPYDVSTLPGATGRLLGLRTTLVIRCKLADHLEDRPGEPAEPTPPGGYEHFFTSAGAGQRTVYDYLNAQMMGSAYYDADITPWYLLPLDEAAVLTARGADRFAIVRSAARAAAADHDITAYQNLVVIVNAPSTASGDRGGDFTGGYPCLIDGNPYGATVIGSSGFDLNGVLQELLHAYPVGGRALNHGRHAYWAGMTSASEYGDPYDVMSAFGNHRAAGRYGDQGANLSAARRQLLGWVPESRRLTYTPDDSVRYAPTTVELRPLGATAPGVQLVVIPVGGDSGHYYTVEHRVRTGWDQVLPADGVLIYEVRPDRIAYLMTRRPQARAEFDAQWGAGESWSAPLVWGRVTVSVHRADASGAEIRLTVA